jgi:8-hydroxy-5-deazaflavin:NADPH oxidoreductase
MRISVIGTGMVGRAIAGRLAALGHEVVIGTRDPERTLARTETGAMGTPPYAVWQQANPGVRLLLLAEAGAHAELIANATHGAVSLSALTAVEASNLAGKVLLDLALPLDFSEGMPPRLSVTNTDSLGERPGARLELAHLVHPQCRSAEERPRGHDRA